MVVLKDWKTWEPENLKAEYIHKSHDVIRTIVGVAYTNNSF